MVNDNQDDAINFLSQNDLVLGKWNFVLDVLINAFFNLLSSNILEHTLKVIFAFVFNAIPQYANKSV